MNQDKVSDFIAKLHDATSAPDTAEAVKLVGSNPSFQAFIMVNYIRSLVRAGFGTEREITDVVRRKLLGDKTFERYFYSPYLATIGLGFEIGKEER